MNLSDFGSITPWALIAFAIVNVIALIKVFAPKVWDSFIARGEQLYDAERQDDIAQWSNMLALQKEIVTQHNRLIDFFMQDFKGDVDALGQAIERLDAKLNAELKDIDNRWVTATRELQGTNNQQRILTSEVTRLGDIISQFQRQLDLITNKFPEIMGRNND